MMSSGVSSKAQLGHWVLGGFLRSSSSLEEGAREGL